MRVLLSLLVAFIIVSLLVNMGCSGEEKNDSAADIPEQDAGVDDTGAAGAAGSTEEADIKDPGKGEWELGTPEYCKMDPTLFDDSMSGTYAVFRYGKLCHMKGTETVDETYSVTKTLGGVMAGRAAYLARDVEFAGPGTGPIRHIDLGTDWIASPIYSNRDATINHIMAMVADASPSLEDSELVFRYDTLGVDAINVMIEATEKCIQQVPGLPADAETFVQQEIFDKMGMASSSWKRGQPTGEIPTEMLDPAFAATGTGIAIGLKSLLSDMGRLGTLLLHDGWYGGERLLSQEWVYRMSHPAFESATTSYGHLTWLNHRGNAVGPEEAFASLVDPMLEELIQQTFPEFAGFDEGDPCAPAAFWPKYPHPPSKATDCRPTVEGTSCAQAFDVGVYNAWGAGGNLIIMHPGLDMVIVTQNFFREDGIEGEPKDIWNAIRPGLVATDPKYQGDEEAFCRDYGAGDYAPDLVAPRWKP